MSKQELNLADLCGLMALICGVMGGLSGSIGKSATWPVVVLFVIVGAAIGYVCAELLGKVAYTCLHSPGSIVSTIGYAIASLAMPMASIFLAFLMPSIILPWIRSA